jgi:hypothetical protein
VNIQSEAQKSSERTVEEDAVKLARVSHQVLPVSHKNGQKLGNLAALSYCSQVVESCVDVAVFCKIMSELFSHLRLHCFRVVGHKLIHGELDVAEFWGLSKFNDEVSWVFEFADFAVKMLEVLAKLLKWTLVESIPILENYEAIKQVENFSGRLVNRCNNCHSFACLVL